MSAPVQPPAEDRAPSIAPTMVVGLLGCAVAAGAFVGAAFWLKDHYPQRPEVMFLLAALYGLAIMGVVGLTLRRVRRISPCISGAGQRQGRRTMAAMWVYVVALLVTIYAKTEGAPLAVLYGLTLLTALPLLTVIWAMLVYLKEETDEFQRMMVLESAFWGMSGVLAVGTVWGFLTFFELAPPPPVFMIFPLWCMFMGLARAVLSRRYR